MRSKAIFPFILLFLTSFPLEMSGYCDLVWYKGSSFATKPTQVHSGFQKQVEKINDFALACGVKVYVTSSFRRVGVTVHGAVVTPARRSNHFVGHAVDMNLIEDGHWCNSKCLKKLPKSLPGVNCFIAKIRSDKALRWGGDFTQPDPVHIDDALNYGDPSLYDKLYTSLQSNCN